MDKVKVGLLPLYLEFYDKKVSDLRVRSEEFLEEIINRLEEKELIIKNSKICRRKEEFKDAVNYFEKEKVAAIITLHLAYSPSLESAEALSSTNIPIIVLNTTPAFYFGSDQSTDEIMYNHGIHGVQDFCSLLYKKGKKYFIETGHYDKSDVLDRVVKKVKSVSLARSMRSQRVGRIGGSFEGMGDFFIPAEDLKKNPGIEVIETDFKEITDLIPGENSEEVKNEILADYKTFKVDNLSKKVHLDSVRIGLAIRKWIEKRSLTSFTYNFSVINKKSGFLTVPFLEASKQMAAGVGFAGEGDVLTASLVGTLLSIYPESSFVEMFCPDWSGDSIFLSHMGEMNIGLVSGKPFLFEKDVSLLETEPPAVAAGSFKPGKAVYINLAPDTDNIFRLLVSEIEMVDLSAKKESLKDNMDKTIRGWFKHKLGISEFLSQFSKHGGTHHSAMVYGDIKDVISDFGRIMNWQVIEI
ncbi:MAG: L-arabinose isomerase family protein [Candidatus Humimicrobiaceae bacterium]